MYIYDYLKLTFIDLSEMLLYLNTLKYYVFTSSDSCISHFNLAPLKVSHGKKQYLYDDRGNMLLDCINNVVQGVFLYSNAAFSQLSYQNITNMIISNDIIIPLQYFSSFLLIPAHCPPIYSHGDAHY